MIKPVYISIEGSKCEKKAVVCSYLLREQIREQTLRVFKFYLAGFAVALCALYKETSWSVLVSTSWTVNTALFTRAPFASEG